MTEVRSIDPTCDRIAIDLDGVLTEHPRPLAHAAAERFGLALPESAFIDSAGLNVPEAVREWVYGPDGPAGRLQPASGAQAFLSRIIELFGAASVRIITARPAASAGITLDWLRGHRFPACEVSFGDDKLTLARSFGCGFAVEDSERHARNYAAGGITCFLLQPDGVMPAAPTPDIIRVTDFQDILRALVAAPALNGHLLHATERARIVVSDAIHPVAREELARHAELIDVDGTDQAALLAVLADADALVVRSETQVTADVLAAAPRLKVVARAGVGVDNIDLASATRAGVLVLNAPGANAVSAGEHTVALLLAITRQLPQANAATHAGRWERKLLRPIDLRGRVAGIVGLGRVGSVVAQRLRGFEMRLVACDPYIPPGRFAELGVEAVDYATLLRMADVVTFHVPSTTETHHMLGAETIGLLKPGAIVLNAARGEVVDQAVLAEAIKAGQVGGAGVDVFSHEPCLDSPLHGLPNVVLTPHIGGSSVEALEAVGRVISASTLAALRGEAVPNAVNMPIASLDAPELRRLTTVAGAAGHLLGVLQPDLPEELRLTVRGLVPADVAEHVLGAALSEALQCWTNCRVTAVNARVVAEEGGVAISTVASEGRTEVVPSFSFAAGGEPSHHVTVSWDRVNAGIVEVDRFSLERALAGDVLITHHWDQPGVVGRLGTILGHHRVNIAGMQVGRHHRGGEAIMVLNVDDVIPEAALAEIRACPGIGSVYVVSLPAAEPQPPPVAIVAG